MDNKVYICRRSTEEGLLLTAKISDHKVIEYCLIANSELRDYRVYKEKESAFCLKWENKTYN